MLRIFFAVVFLFGAASLFSDEKEIKQRKVSLILTVPKSGTHLLKKVFAMTIGIDRLYYGTPARDPYNPPFIPDNWCYIFNHVYPGFSHYRDGNQGQYLKVLLIRDPRDAIVSLMMHIERFHEWGPWLPKHKIEEFCNLSQQEKLKTTMLLPDQHLGLQVFVREALEWMKDPDVLVVRFEDLVGPQGGGDRVRQEKTIQALSDHLGFGLSEEKVAFVADNLFGSSWSFRKGQIGTWRDCFTESDKALFKSLMGKELIQMGYESDNDW